jgi:hypothetical protein
MTVECDINSQLSKILQKKVFALKTPNLEILFLYKLLTFVRSYKIIGWKQLPGKNPTATIVSHLSTVQVDFLLLCTACSGRCSLSGPHIHYKSNTSHLECSVCLWLLESKHVMNLGLWHTVELTVGLCSIIFYHNCTANCIDKLEDAKMFMLFSITTFHSWIV